MRFSPFVTLVLPLSAFAALPDIRSGTPLNAAAIQVLNDTLQVFNALNVTVFTALLVEDPPQKAVAWAACEAQENIGNTTLALATIIDGIGSGATPRDAEYVDNPSGTAGYMLNL
jgi:hypothetical protein